MEKYKFTEYDFERPPKIQLIAEKIIYGLLGKIIWYKPINSLLDLEGSERLLDFGCGSGFYIEYLARSMLKKGSIVGLDSSRFYIERARRRLNKYHNIELIAGNIKDIDIDPEYFGIITCNHVIHDIYPQKRQIVINSLADKLKKSGKIYISEPTKKSHGIAINEIKELFRNAGLREIDFIKERSRYTSCWEK